MNSNLRIVCVGAHLESEIALRRFISAGLPVAALVTSPAGRSRGISDFCDLHPLCQDNGIPVIDTNDINSRETLDSIGAAEPDYIFTLGWNRLFGTELLDTPASFVVGSHPTRLPDGRGRAPIPWTVLLGKTQSAVTLFKMIPRPDAGDILVQVPFDITPNSYAFDVYQKAAGAMGDGYLQLYEGLVNGDCEAVPQDCSQASHYAKRTPADGHVQFSKSAREIDALIRAVSYPYPGAYTYYGDTRIRIWAVEFDRLTGSHLASPGQIIQVKDSSCLVMTGDRPLWVSDLSSDDPSFSFDALRQGARFGYAVEDTVHRLVVTVGDLSRRLDEISKPRP